MVQISCYCWATLSFDIRELSESRSAQTVPQVFDAMKKQLEIDQWFSLNVTVAETYPHRSGHSHVCPPPPPLHVEARHVQRPSALCDIALTWWPYASLSIVIRRQYVVSAIDTGLLNLRVTLESTDSCVSALLNRFPGSFPCTRFCLPILIKTSAPYSLITRNYVPRTSFNFFHFVYTAELRSFSSRRVTKNSHLFNGWTLLLTVQSVTQFPPVRSTTFPPLSVSSIRHQLPFSIKLRAASFLPLLHPHSANCCFLARQFPSLLQFSYLRSSLHPPRLLTARGTHLVDRVSIWIRVRRQRGLLLFCANMLRIGLFAGSRFCPFGSIW